MTKINNFHKMTILDSSLLHRFKTLHYIQTLYVIKRRIDSKRVQTTLLYFLKVWSLNDWSFTDIKVSRIIPSTKSIRFFSIPSESDIYKSYRTVLNRRSKKNRNNIQRYTLKNNSSSLLSSFVFVLLSRSDRT